MVSEEQTEPQTEEQEEQTEEPSYQEKVLQRLKDQGDTRVPSNPENLKPADIPPKPLTRAGYSETK
jgi:hypothetical protein